MEISKDKLFVKEYFLAAGECNAESEMPLTLLANRLIEIATLHANYWNVGYKRLQEENRGWVLSRMAIEMKRYPRINETYRISTWVESYNRHFSERNMEITDEDGNVLGYARTIWMVIDFTTRESCNLAELEYIQKNTYDKECPIERQGRIKKLTPERQSHYTFAYSDIDFNRHVNSVRYISLFLNQWEMEHHDHFRIARFEIAYTKEAYIGESVTITTEETETEAHLEIASEQTSHCKARIVFEKRQ